MMNADTTINTSPLSRILQALPRVTFFLPFQADAGLGYRAACAILDNSAGRASDILPISFRTPLSSVLEAITSPWQEELAGVDFEAMPADGFPIPGSNSNSRQFSKLLEHMMNADLGPDFLGNYARQSMKALWQERSRWLFWDAERVNWIKTVAQDFQHEDCLCVVLTQNGGPLDPSFMPPVRLAVASFKSKPDDDQLLAAIATAVELK